MFPRLLQESQVSIFAIGLMFRYLEDMLMAEQIVPFATFYPYHGESKDAFLNVRTNMILDFASQEALEIFNSGTEEEQNESL